MEWAFHKGDRISLSCNPSQTKATATLEANQLNFKWTEGDQILVKVGEASSIFTLREGSDGIFDGIMPADGNCFDIQYPVQAPDLSVQDYTAGGIDATKMLSIRKNCTPGEPLRLEPQYAVLTLAFTGEDRISSLELKRNGTDESYTVISADGIQLSSAPTTFGLVIPKERFDKGFTAVLRDKDGNIVDILETSNPVDLSSGAAVCMKEKTIVRKPYHRDHAYVDLGTPGTLWAVSNIGAPSPGVEGDYFAFGETAPKENYAVETYKFYNKGTYTPYNTASAVLSSEDDAAHVLWGGNWRIPTKNEWLQLVEKCNWTLTTESGVKVYKVSNKKDSSKFIYLPFPTHRMVGTSLTESTDMYDSTDKRIELWSSNGHNTARMGTILFYPSRLNTKDGTKYWGYGIRPVFSE